MGNLTYAKDSLKRVLKGGRQKVLVVVSFLVFLTLYSFVLPAAYTGGRVGIVSLKLLNLKLFLFAFSYAVVLSLFVAVQAYSFSRVKRIGEGKGIFGFFSSLLPPLLCCSPLIPSLFALAGAFLPFLLPFSGLFARLYCLL